MFRTLIFGVKCYWSLDREHSIPRIETPRLHAYKKKNGNTKGVQNTYSF